MIARDAVLADLPTIIRLRDAYYAARGAEVQVRSPALWRVVEVEGRVIAVQAYDDPAPGQRVITDTYVEPCRQAVWALRMLDRDAKARARHDGVMLIGITEPDNTAQRDASLRHGWKETGILLTWEPRETL
jgi:hypothetical protein